MVAQQYEKVLTANDTGETGGHQAGVHIPKSQKDLIAFLPILDAAKKNPDAWLCVSDEDGVKWSFRYIYYNNRLHDTSGTRDEYRITHMTKYFRAAGAKSGDTLVLFRSEDSEIYKISIRKSGQEECTPEKIGVRIRLKGWRRVH